MKSSRAFLDFQDGNADGEVTVELSLEPEDEMDHVFTESDQRKDLDQNLVDPQEVYAEAEVDLMLQQSLVNLKLEEKSVASLSPVVEDRLLRNIYQKYALETTGYLTLSRYFFLSRHPLWLC